MLIRPVRYLTIAIATLCDRWLVQPLAGFLERRFQPVWALSLRVTHPPYRLRMSLHPMTRTTFWDEFDVRVREPDGVAFRVVCYGQADRLLTQTIWRREHEALGASSLSTLYDSPCFEKPSTIDPLCYLDLSNQR